MRRPYTAGGQDEVVLRAEDPDLLGYSRYIVRDNDDPVDFDAQGPQVPAEELAVGVLKPV